jgi:hypothetical protein
MNNAAKVSTEKIKNFGRGDAYKDPQLYECFLKSPEYKKAERGELLILVGAKGSGKSSILKYLQEESPNNDERFSLLLSDEDYKKGTFEQPSGSDLDVQKIAQNWTLNLRIELIKKIYSEKDHFPKAPKKDLSKIVSLIKYNKEINQDFLPRFVRFLKRITKVEIPNIAGYGGGGVEVKEMSDKFREKLEATIPHVKEVLKAKRVFVLVDDTDFFVDALNLKYDSISGLIAAADSLGDDFKSSINFVILISLRSDIFSEIAKSYDQIGNLREVIAQISWGKEELKRLIAERIRKPYKLECDDDTAWNALFDQHIGTDKTDTFDYILERSFYRPRDIIQFCNLALEDAQSKRNERITQQNIKNAEKDYSEHKYQDISAEYKHKYGKNLSDLLLEPFKNTKAELTAFELGNIVISKIRNAQKPKPDWITPETGKEEIIEVMYEIGLLGVKEGAHYVFSFQKETKNLHEKEHFQIHKAFHKYLNIS